MSNIVDQYADQEARSKQQLVQLNRYCRALIRELIAEHEARLTASNVPVEDVEPAHFWQGLSE